MSTISAGTTTTTALVSTGDTSGQLVLRTNGSTTAVTIDTAQRVGIGTSTPAAELHVLKSGADAKVFVESTASGAGLVSLYAPSQALAAYNSISSNYGATTNSWYIGGYGVADTLTIRTSNTERFRITNAGAWGLSGANYGTSGQVLTSNGSAAAPTWQAAASGAQGFVTMAIGPSTAPGEYSDAFTLI